MKIATVIGARPQFIKAAPVSRAFCEAGIEETIIDTGQHYDERMSAIFFQELGLPRPAYSLAIGSGSHGTMTGRMLEAVEGVLSRQETDAVLVYGDTNSTLAGALAAAKLNIPVVHIEAGLRSFRSTMPEEINRKLTDHLSTVLFCPSDLALENLRREGINDLGGSGGSIYVRKVGDVMVDALRLFGASSTELPIVAQFGPRNYVIATIHRAETTDDVDTLTHVAASLRKLSSAVPVLLPLHPRTRVALQRIGILEELMSTPGLHVIEPLGYRAFTGALAGALAVVTDSGGLQKEAMIMGVPCVTLRDETEWTETVKLGWNILAGKCPENLSALVLGTSRPCDAPPDVYGDGRASQRIADELIALGATRSWRQAAT
jgi:UDP-N-acetylglucosamine 2-epimerase